MAIKLIPNAASGGGSGTLTGGGTAGQVAVFTDTDVLESDAQFKFDPVTGLDLEMGTSATPGSVTIKSGSSSGGNGGNILVQAGLGTGGGAVGGAVTLQGGGDNGGGGVFVKASNTSGNQIQCRPDGVVITAGPTNSNNDLTLSAASTDGRVFVNGGFSGGSITLSTGIVAVLINSAGDVLAHSDVAIDTLGKGLKIKEGTNARMGVATLVGGAVTVGNTSVTANSRIFVMSQADGGTPGWLRVSARTPATSFTITSSSGTDTSDVAWLIVEPA